MELTKKHYLIFAGLLAICILVVVLTLQMTPNPTSVDEQVGVAGNQRDTHEQEQKERLEKEVGVAIPSYEEVQRLVSVTDDQMLHEGLILAEYGSKYADFIYWGYVRGSLPSATDSPLVASAKKALITGDFGENMYPPAVNLLIGDFIASPPYATISDKFSQVQPELYAGFIQGGALHIQGVTQTVPTLYLTTLYLPKKSMTVSEFEALLATLPVTVNGMATRPMNDVEREVRGKDAPIFKGNNKAITYLSIDAMDFETLAPEDVTIPAGTPVYVTYYVELANTGAEGVEKLDIDINGTLFEAPLLHESLYIPYNLTD